MLGCERQPLHRRIADPGGRVRPLCQKTCVLACVLVLSLSLMATAHIQQGAATVASPPPFCTLRRGQPGLRVLRLRGGTGGSEEGGGGQMALTSHAQGLLSRAVQLAQSKGNIEVRACLHPRHHSPPEQESSLQHTKTYKSTVETKLVSPVRVHGGCTPESAASAVESRSECLRPVVYSSRTGFTSCIVIFFRSRRSFVSSPL